MTPARQNKNKIGGSKRTEHMQAHIDPLEQISVISPQRQLKFTLAKAMNVSQFDALQQF